MLIRTGHGSQDPTHPQGRCTCFDGITVTADPLPNRKDRVTKRPHGHGVDYGAYELRLGKLDRKEGNQEARYLMVRHGAGAELWLLDGFYDNGETVAAIEALPPKVLFGLLYKIWYALKEARLAAMRETENEWKAAAISGRIKTRRNNKAGKAWAWMIPEQREGEADYSYKIRCQYAAPSSFQ